MTDVFLQRWNKDGVLNLTLPKKSNGSAKRVPVS